MPSPALCWGADISKITNFWGPQQASVLMPIQRVPYRALELSHSDTGTPPESLFPSNASVNPDSDADSTQGIQAPPAWCQCRRTAGSHRAYRHPLLHASTFPMHQFPYMAPSKPPCQISPPTKLLDDASAPRSPHPIGAVRQLHGRHVPAC